MKFVLISLGLATLAFAHEGHDHSHDHSHADEGDAAAAIITPDEPTVPKITPATYTPTIIQSGFYESFQGDTSRWLPSDRKKVVDGVEDEDLLRFRGIWAFEEPTEWLGIAGDKALVVKTKAAHHAIAAKFDSPIDNKGKTLVIQYEVKFQNNHDCGGAYLKLLTHDPTFTANNFDDKTPYSIMFGPDKCGGNNKVHFIFRHKNEKTGVYEEKHMNGAPAGKIEKKTGLYTLVIKPDNSFDMLINKESVKKGSLLEDFTPPVNAAKEIEDPTDVKPADWVDEEKMADPVAKKPEDWDENAPAEILDEEAQKPADWLDNEPETIADPKSTKPDDWDDEEDGDWIAPTIANPKCEDYGCGEWKRPMKVNPAYKGKWTVPMIPNPAYKGVWKAKIIPNPDYNEDLHPSNFNKIGAIGFELWTMNDGITFDNIYVGHDIDQARKLADNQWAVKFEVEKKYESAEAPPEKKPDDKKSEDDNTAAIVKAFLNPKETLETLYAQGVNEFNEIRANYEQFGALETFKKFKNIFISGIFVSYFLFAILLRLISGGGAEPKVKEKKKEEEKDSGEEDEKEEAETEPTVVKKESPSDGNVKKRAGKSPKE